ncbi:hypothetical protein RvY_03317 [Ramazzottius varieornatus]|uniref:Uncharacterized protein n=1 Tax=Ramazzottius varieornatus TaxID=947166 RepID=A0A1D1UMN8_RAMVA|nr:hypothetical protein RvY_03317 [Ramazzottius varieornatus]
MAKTPETILFETLTGWRTTVTELHESECSPGPTVPSSTLYQLDGKSHQLFGLAIDWIVDRSE